MHHPFFFDFFYPTDVGGGFQLDSGLFCPWAFGDIVFGLRGVAPTAVDLT
jgi:hypothetical protein